MTEKQFNQAESIDNLIPEAEAAWVADIIFRIHYLSIGLPASIFGYIGGTVLKNLWKPIGFSTELPFAEQLPMIVAAIVFLLVFIFATIIRKIFAAKGPRSPSWSGILLDLALMLLFIGHLIYFQGTLADIAGELIWEAKWGPVMILAIIWLRPFTFIKHRKKNIRSLIKFVKDTKQNSTLGI